MRRYFTSITLRLALLALSLLPGPALELFA